MKKKLRKFVPLIFFFYNRPVAEVFGRVCVLTRIFFKAGGGGGGGIKYERRRCERLGGSGGMPLLQKILKSGGPEMQFSASCLSLFQTRWSVK